LQLDHTQVSDIEPLAKLKDLEQLFLLGTPVRDVTPLKGLKKLEVLDLTFTEVHDVAPLMGLTNLRTLKLDGARVSKEDFRLLEQALPNLDIEWSPFRAEYRPSPKPKEALPHFPRRNVTLDDSVASLRDHLVVGNWRTVKALSTNRGARSIEELYEEYNSIDPKMHTRQTVVRELGMYLAKNPSTGTCWFSSDNVRIEFQHNASDSFALLYVRTEGEWKLDCWGASGISPSGFLRSGVDLEVDIEREGPPVEF
jgi:hypothetical protein